MSVPPWGSTGSAVSMDRRQLGAPMLLPAGADVVALTMGPYEGGPGGAEVLVLFAYELDADELGARGGLECIPGEPRPDNPSGELRRLVRCAFPEARSWALDVAGDVLAPGSAGTYVLRGSGWSSAGPATLRRVDALVILIRKPAPAGPEGSPRAPGPPPPGTTGPAPS